MDVCADRGSGRAFRREAEGHGELREYGHICALNVPRVPIRVATGACVTPGGCEAGGESRSLPRVRGADVSCNEYRRHERDCDDGDARRARRGSRDTRDRDLATQLSVRVLRRVHIDIRGAVHDVRHPREVAPGPEPQSRSTCAGGSPWRADRVEDGTADRLAGMDVYTRISDTRTRKPQRRPNGLSAAPVGVDVCRESATSLRRRAGRSSDHVLRKQPSLQLEHGSLGRRRGRRRGDQQRDSRRGESSCENAGHVTRFARVARNPLAQHSTGLDLPAKLPEGIPGSADLDVEVLSVEGAPWIAVDEERAAHRSVPCPRAITSTAIAAAESMPDVARFPRRADADDDVLRYACQVRERQTVGRRAAPDAPPPRKASDEASARAIGDARRLGDDEAWPQDSGEVRSTSRLRPGRSGAECRKHDACEGECCRVERSETNVLHDRLLGFTMWLSAAAEGDNSGCSAHADLSRSATNDDSATRPQGDYPAGVRHDSTFAGARTRCDRDSGSNQPQMVIRSGRIRTGMWGELDIRHRRDSGHVGVESCHLIVSPFTSAMNVALGTG